MDAREIAKAIVEGEWELFDDAEHKLTAAFEAGDEAAKAFWRSVFEELREPLKQGSTMDDVSFYTYEMVLRYADGASPLGELDDGEKNTPC